MSVPERASLLSYPPHIYYILGDLQEGQPTLYRSDTPTPPGGGGGLMPAPR